MPKENLVVLNRMVESWHKEVTLAEITNNGAESSKARGRHVALLVA